MTAMETLMIIMMGFMALAVLLSWHWNVKMMGEIHRLREETKRLRDEASLCYTEAEFGNEKMFHDLHELMYCVDMLRMALIEHGLKETPEEVREPFFSDEPFVPDDDDGDESYWIPTVCPERECDDDIVEGLKHDGVWDPEPLDDPDIPGETLGVRKEEVDEVAAKAS